MDKKRSFDGKKRPPFKPGDKRGGKPFDKSRREQKPAEKPARGELDARKLALRSLADVVRGKAYAQLALSEHLRASSISLEDKRLATSIFYTALENLIRIDWILERFITRKPEPIVEDILRIAVAQLLFMDKMPDHAVVNEATNQVKLYKREASAGFVNGTLRSVIRARDAGEIVYPDPEAEPIKYLSIMHSVPEVLIERLVRQYGVEYTKEMIAYSPDERVETVRPNLLRMDAQAFEAYAQKRNWSFEKGIVPGALRVKSAGNLPGDPEYRDGLYSIQGEGSMLAAYAVEPRRAQSILDACAAPGGKAALISEIMGGTGRVQAWDVHPHRVELMQAAQKRLKLETLRPMQRDATVLREDLEMTFDAVLIDAPCSGLGVMVNKPDIKYRVTEESITSLAELQRRILNTCCRYVKPGGLLVYSTCTILREENEDQIDAFLRAHPEYAPETSLDYLPEQLRPYADSGRIQLQAHRDGIEGFFIARLRRRTV